MLLIVRSSEYWGTVNILNDWLPPSSSISVSNAQDTLEWRTCLWLLSTLSPKHHPINLFLHANPVTNSEILQSPPKQDALDLSLTRPPAFTNWPAVAGRLPCRFSCNSQQASKCLALYSPCFMRLWNQTAAYRQSTEFPLRYNSTAAEGGRQGTPHAYICHSSIFLLQCIQESQSPSCERMSWPLHTPKAYSN